MILNMIIQFLSERGIIGLKKSWLVSRVLLAVILSKVKKEECWREEKFKNYKASTGADGISIYGKNENYRNWQSPKKNCITEEDQRGSLTLLED